MTARSAGARARATRSQSGAPTFDWTTAIAPTAMRTSATRRPPADAVLPTRARTSIATTRFSRKAAMASTRRCGPFVSQGNSIPSPSKARTPPKPGEPADALYRVGTPGYLSTIGA